ncbi:MAG TPA: hypothetical protein ENI53_00065 [Thermoplasmatales archaeon]|nr:hypothetical protein [Thermoplasmatales archaeon]
MLRLMLSLLVVVSLILPILSYKSFLQIIKLVKIRRGNLLVGGTLFLLTGYLFFLLPWIFVGEDIIEVRILSYYIILAGMLTLSYGAIKIYTDWREVVK